MLSQLVTLYLTPVVYTFMAALLGKWKSRETVELEPEPTFSH
jgi:hypothetical protein